MWQTMISVGSWKRKMWLIRIEGSHEGMAMADGLFNICSPTLIAVIGGGEGGLTVPYLKIR